MAIKFAVGSEQMLGKKITRKQIEEKIIKINHRKKIATNVMNQHNFNNFALAFNIFSIGDFSNFFCI